jgi:hypothetical protein
MSRLLRILGPLSAAAVLVSSCKREVPPAGEDARVPTTEAAPTPAAATPAAPDASTLGASPAATATTDLSVSPTKPVKAAKKPSAAASATSK